MDKEHHYNTRLDWTGNKGQGTASYSGYDRDHVLAAGIKPEIPGSSDPSFQGNPQRYNPEELLVASLSACHMLWYLHLCSVNGVVVVDYHDEAAGTMVETRGGKGHFSAVVLRPIVTVTDAAMEERAMALHDEAHAFCFIASSCNFPITHEPEIRVVDEGM
jgi:organic hydroperoxide reductase OsmC/OhrA